MMYAVLEFFKTFLQSVEMLIQGYKRSVFSVMYAIAAFVEAANFVMSPYKLWMVFVKVTFRLWMDERINPVPGLTVDCEDSTLC